MNVSLLISGLLVNVFSLTAFWGSPLGLMFNLIGFMLVIIGLRQKKEQ